MKYSRGDVVCKGRMFLENANLCLLPGGTYHPEYLIAGTTHKTFGGRRFERRRSLEIDIKKIEAKK
jgi:hypothetical protein